MNFLEGADEGEVSDVLELTSNFVVVKVEEIIPEGYRPFDEVKSQVENQVKIEKRKEMTVQNLKNLLSSNPTVEGIAEAAGKEVQTASNLSANAMVIPGGGREPEVIGAIFSLDEGATSGVLAGNSAAFVVTVNDKTEADLSNLDQATRNQIRQQLEQQKTQKFNEVWLAQLKEEADIVDNRDRLLNQ